MKATLKSLVSNVFGSVNKSQQAEEEILPPSKYLCIGSQKSGKSTLEKHFRFIYLPEAGTLNVFITQQQIYVKIEFFL